MAKLSQKERYAVWDRYFPERPWGTDAYGHLMYKYAPKGSDQAWEADHIFPKKHLETIGVESKGIDHPDNLWPMGMRGHPNPVKSNVLMPRGRHQKKRFIPI